MEISSHLAYQQRLSTKLSSWLKRHSRRLDPLWRHAALLLLRLDLDPVAPDLVALYSTSPRGRPPLDPLALLRSLLLMPLLNFSNFDHFAAALRSSSRLAIIAGFDPDKTPSVGAFYAFLDRLEDGPFQPACAHCLNPSQQRKLSRRRNLAVEKHDRQQRHQALLLQAHSVTHHLKEQLLAQASQPRPRDLQQRLEDLLLKVAVRLSAKRGLLGDLHHLLICGDGSALESAACSLGRPTCQCRQQRVYRCSCDRLYADPTADWGYDSYREDYYFGHTFYQHVVHYQGHDLPVHLTIGPASESDFTLSLKSLDRFQKACRDNHLDLQVEAVAYDCGHDALGIYEYLQAKQIKAVIALNERRGLPSPTGTAQQVNAEGVPLCVGGLPMRRHAKAANHRLYYNCPVKRPTHLHGKALWQSHVQECPLGVLCQPQTQMGPVVYVRVDEDPRLYPEIARDSPRYREVMKQRTACERSNATKKVTYKLGQRACRNASHYLIRLYLISILEHARVWLAEDRKRYGDEVSKLVKCAKAGAAPPP